MQPNEVPSAFRNLIKAEKAKPKKRYGIYKIRVRPSIWVAHRSGNGLVHAVDTMTLYQNHVGDRANDVHHISVTFRCKNSSFYEKLYEVEEGEAGAPDYCQRCAAHVLYQL